MVRKARDMAGIDVPLRRRFLRCWEAGSTRNPGGK
jgi:hypothetical protein